MADVELLPHQVHRAEGTVEKTEAHIAKVKAAQKREKKKEEERSPKWPAARRKHLKAHPECAACGSRQGLQVHHRLPFHANPALELDPENLVTLCMYVGGLLCHEKLGHHPKKGFKWYNPFILADAAELRAYPERLGSIYVRVSKAAKPNAAG